MNHESALGSILGPSFDYHNQSFFSSFREPLHACIRTRFLFILLNSLFSVILSLGTQFSLLKRS